MAAGPHCGRFQARIVGAGITLGLQVEADMWVAEGDMVMVEVMAMAMVEASIILRHILADTVLAVMMVATVLGVVDRREVVVEAEVSEPRLATWSFPHFFNLSLAYLLSSTSLRVTNPIFEQRMIRRSVTLWYYE